MADVLTINWKFVISASKRFAVTTLIPCEMQRASGCPGTREVARGSGGSIARC